MDNLWTLNMELVFLKELDTKPYWFDALLGYIMAPSPDHWSDHEEFLLKQTAAALFKRHCKERFRDFDGG